MGLKVAKILHWKNENTQFFYNFLSTAIRSGITVLTMPIFTRLLGAEQYGKYSLYISWLTICTCFMGLQVSGLGTGIYQFKQDYKKLRSSILVEGTVASFALIGIAIVFLKPLSHVLGFPQVFTIVMLVEAFAQFIINFASSAWIYEKKASYNMVSSLTVLFSTTLLSVTLLLAFRDRLSDLYYARVWGTAVPQILIAVFIWIFIFNEEKFGYKKEYWLYGLHFGLPMIFHTLSHQVLIQSDRVMMQKFSISDSEIGVYSFFYTFTAVLSTILSALNNSWVPFLYEFLNQKEYNKLNQKVNHYVQLFTMIVCGFLLLSREVVKIFANSEYWIGMPLIPFLSLVIYFTFLYQFPVNYEFFHKKPGVTAGGTTITALVNICLNWLLIPKYGMYGAVIATLISYMILALMHIAIVKSWKQVPYPITGIPMIKGLGEIIFICILYYVLADYWFIRWMLGAIIGVYLLLTIKKRKTIF